jgi:hypothetical protein
MHTLADLRAGKLAGIKRLDLSCGLTEFPREIFDLGDTLEVLNLSGNALTSLPEDLYRLRNLRVLFASDNKFRELPACIGRCEQLRIVGLKANRIEQVPAQALPPRLRWLILTDNRIASLPDELGRRPDLQKLMLAGNRLTRLPDTLADCHKLELIRIAANRLHELPSWLLKLPSLAWLAFADNPLCGAVVERPLRQIAWPSLMEGQRLGEGASGVILQAQWQAGDSQQPVAIKLYKGDVTSDGSPLNEMAACIAAGQHPQLIGVLGKVSEHPQGTQGLVMELIAPSFRNLAGPPDLESCTRDIYPAGLRIEPAALLRMATELASVTAHLHAQGVTHGDLYGHNILWQMDGKCLLGDFGAASFLPGTDPRSDINVALMGIETRAYGILLGELLERCEPETYATAALHGLRRLQQNCIQPTVDARPSMAEVVGRLQAWSL